MPSSTYNSTLDVRQRQALDPVVRKLNEQILLLKLENCLIRHNRDELRQERDDLREQLEMFVPPWRG